MNSDLRVIRDKLDAIDQKLIELFTQRMDLINEVAEVKRAANISISDEAREQEIIDRMVSLSKTEYAGEAKTFTGTLLSLSKYRQRKLLFDNREEELLPPSRKAPEKDISVAYQGVPGAWGEQAAIQMFNDNDKMGLDSFEEVFKSVKEGQVDYGVVPIENSRTGAIGEVYDLLRKYGCYIVAQTWVPVRHCLIANKGTKLEDIREVFSHPEGFRQCRNFLKGRPWDLSSCRNTAVAVEMVAKEKGNKRIAAIGSKRAADLHDLDIVVPDIIDDKANKTRFIAIASAPEYDETCDAISITFSVSHRSGALCEVLFHFMSAGINLSRIESRPMMGNKYCFFTDLEGNILDENVARGIRNASACCGYLEVLGCYKSNV
ncbi:MAG: bifunctional chorismate mutase/prephenate dehydratase [Clostridiales bacterium]|nr:bifunctional chorismate mutase/prephenate dehydratase [Clostridiales bacterium]